MKNVKIEQEGIINTILTGTESVRFDYGDTDKENVDYFVSGQISNISGTVPYSVRINLLGFTQGKVDISIPAGKSLMLENLRITSIFALTGSTNLQVIGIRTKITFNESVDKSEIYKMFTGNIYIG
jgi:hypothetical protein